MLINYTELLFMASLYCFDSIITLTKLWSGIKKDRTNFCHFLVCSYNV